LYHSIIPDKDLKERVPVLVHGNKRLVDSAVIVVRVCASLRAFACPCVHMRACFKITAPPEYGCEGPAAMHGTVVYAIWQPTASAFLCH
jgi:hypothetical protein